MNVFRKLLFTFISIFLLTYSVKAADGPNLKESDYLKKIDLIYLELKDSLGSTEKTGDLNTDFLNQVLQYQRALIALSKNELQYGERKELKQQVDQFIDGLKLNLKKISKEGVPVNLYDTKGLELSETVQAQIKKEILDEIDRCNDLCIKNDNKSELIHVCWYCIDGSVRRCEETDIEWINDIAVKVPVIVVVTKGFPKKDAREFKKKIENLNLNCSMVVPVLAEKYEDRDEEDEDDEVIIIPSYGLEKLVEVTLEVLPDGVRRAFNNAQKVSLDKKVSAARKWVTGYAATTGAIGASPIPFSDAPLLVGAQLSMLAHVTAIFGLPVEKAVLTAIIGSVAGVSGTTLGGKTLVSNLLKCIPGVGTVAGGVISASVASMMTVALGLAYISVLKYIIEEENKGNEVST